jgi:hypothetical protein
LPIFGNFEQDWHLVAFKPGYVMGSDENAWKELNNYGAPKYKTYTPMLLHPDISLWLGWGIWISPIELKSEDMTLQQADTYYHGLLRVEGNAKKNKNDELKISLLAYPYFQQKFCSVESDEQLGTAWPGGFVPDRDRFMQTLKGIDPAKFEESESSPVPKYRAGFGHDEICEAMKAARTSQ